MKKTDKKSTNSFVFFILGIPRFILKGFYVLSYLLYSFIIKHIVKYITWGFIVISYFVFMIFAWPFKILGKSKTEEKLLSKRAEKAEELRKAKELAAIKKQQKLLEKQEKKEKAFIKKHEEKALEEKRRKELEEDYVNENVKLEKHDLNWALNKLFNGIAQAPKKIGEAFKKMYENSTLYKNAKNKDDINRQALLLSFEGEDAEKSEVKIVYEYIARDANGKTVKGYFDAFSKVEVHSYLLSEGFEVYSIRTSKWIQLLHGSSGRVENVKVKHKDLIFMLTQLSTYIKAGIPLVDALKILSKQYKQKNYQKVFTALIYDLSMGDSFSDALAKQGEAFPRLLINMVKASELTGELPEALDDMVQYYTEAEEARKEMVSALTYPSIVFLFTLAVVTFVMMYVVPKFVDIYNTMDSSQVPKFTMSVINFSNFLKKNVIWILLFIIIIALVLVYLYKNVQVIRTFFQWIFMHIPVLKDVIIYNEVTMFSKTFASLLAHNVHITDSMEILGKVTNNEFYKMMILDTIANLARGDKISSAYKDQWAFPVPAYEMIVTGEKTGQLPEMMAKVSTYYQSLHKNTVSRIKSLVEPILIIFLTFSVGLILLAVIIPMFNMYQQVQRLG